MYKNGYLHVVIPPKPTNPKWDSIGRGLSAVIAYNRNIENSKHIGINKLISI